MPVGSPGPLVLAQEYDANNADQQMPLGSTFTDDRGGVYVYCEGVASLASGEAVTIEGSFVVARATKAQIDKLYLVGAARSAFVASEFGFVQVVGFGNGGGIQVLASAGAEVALYSSGTAGALDDDATSQTRVYRIMLATAQGGSAGVNTSARYWYPSV